ncbi:MAG: hypothetical protein JRN15_05040 [Nitrososphaerota archaeon]|nr:hypothetical protein [Nitrososphaerota archaeon]
MTNEKLRKQVEEAEAKAQEIKEAQELKERLRKAKQIQEANSLMGRLLTAVEGLFYPKRS